MYISTVGHQYYLKNTILIQIFIQLITSFNTYFTINKHTSIVKVFYNCIKEFKVSKFAFLTYITVKLNTTASDYFSYVADITYTTSTMNTQICLSKWVKTRWTGKVLCYKRWSIIFK